MTKHLIDQRVPSQAEIDAAIRRAHHERAEAFRRILGALFLRRKANADAAHLSGIEAAASR